MGGGSCDTQEISPVNVGAAAGDGSATVTWEIPPYDTAQVKSVGILVLYAEGGGPGEQCAKADVNHVPEGCVRAVCGSGGASSCTVTGLTNGVSYTFTVVATAYPQNLYDCARDAFARSAPVTPTGP